MNHHISFRIPENLLNRRARWKPRFELTDDQTPLGSEGMWQETTLRMAPGTISTTSPGEGKARCFDRAGEWFKNSSEWVDLGLITLWLGGACIRYSFGISNGI